MMRSTVATFCFMFGSAARRRCSYTNPAYHVLCLHESNLLYAPAVCFAVSIFYVHRAVHHHVQLSYR
jgi:hypothetical protein